MVASRIYTNDSFISSDNLCNRKQTNVETEYAAWLEWSRNRRRSTVRDLMSGYVNPLEEMHMVLQPQKRISASRHQNETVSATKTLQQTCIAAGSQRTSDRIETETTKGIHVDIDFSSEAIKLQEEIWQQIQHENMAKNRKEKASPPETSRSCLAGDDKCTTIPFHATKPEDENNRTMLSKSMNDIRKNEETAWAHLQKRAIRRSFNDAGTQRQVCESVINDDRASRKDQRDGGKKKERRDNHLHGLQYLLATQFHGRNVKLVFQDKIDEAFNSGMGYRTDCIGCGIELKSTKDATLIFCPKCGTIAQRDAITLTPVTPKPSWEDKVRLKTNAFS